MAAPSAPLTMSSTTTSPTNPTTTQPPTTTPETISAATAKKKTQQKPKSLPPPGEAFRVTKPSSTGKKKGAQTAKPMTTKEKVTKGKSAVLSKTAGKKGMVQSKTRGKVGGNGKGKGGKVEKTKKASFISRLEMQEPTTIRGLIKKSEPVSVMIRPTEKAKWWRRKLGLDVKQTVSTGSEEVEIQVFRVMDLPEELRAIIWKLSVVETDFLVFPNLPTGREQPDLAMVSRQVRKEVLPIYYGQNIFGVELVEDMIVPKSKRTGFEEIAKWSACLEVNGWFGMIRKWAFIYTPNPVPSRAREDDGSLVVAVKFVKCQRGFWSVDTGAVQVHHDAQCILPGAEEYDQCVIRTSPKWLNDLVDKVTRAAKGGAIRGSMIVNLAREIQTRGNQLVEFRCEKDYICSS